MKKKFKHKLNEYRSSYNMYPVAELKKKIINDFRLVYLIQF